MPARSVAAALFILIPIPPNPQQTLWAKRQPLGNVNMNVQSPKRQRSEQSKKKLQVTNKQKRE